MAVASVILLQILLLLLGINGKRFRTPCQNNALFRCDDGSCVAKNNWCDNSKDCDDGSDEKYCKAIVRGSFFETKRFPPPCDNKVHFICENYEMCIPKEGYCDGYRSCSDGSDEKNCPCEMLLAREEILEYEVSIGHFQTQQKCWKIAVKEGQFLNISIQATLYNRECNHGSITVFCLKENHEPYYHNSSYPGRIDLCPVANFASLTCTRDVKISYRSSLYSSESGLTDFFDIKYKKVDTVCLNPEMFKCSDITCVSPELRCDGTEDCANGLDEENCDFTAFAAAYLEKNREKTTKWMRSQHNADWGWKENTHRAVMALYLNQDINFNKSSNEDELIAKQLEVEVLTYLLRSRIDKISPTELSTYIDALLVICHNPRNFYGFDLIQKLKEEIKVPGYVASFPYLTLCNAKENISAEDVDSLWQNFEKPSNHGFILEVKALTIMALSCISNTKPYMHINITDELNSLKEQQKEDGSFGSEYTTALVLQALISSNQTNDRSWDFKSFKASIDFLLQKQNADGSFGDFLTTYLVMPILNAKSLVDVGKVNCTESLKRPREGDLISDIKSRLGGKVTIKYSLYIGDEMDQIHPIVLRTPENVTVLEVMELASDIDPKYKFKTHDIMKKTYVYEISGIPNDPENNKFWFFYRDDGNDTVPMSTQSPDEISVSENDHILAWYKTLTIV